MRVRFADCTFDSETREFLRGEEAVHLHPKAFRLLEILLENRPRALSKVTLASGENIIGRDRNAIVRIDDSTISRRHARIVVAGKRVTIEDLGSKNGTFVEGKRIENPRVLSDGERIQVGSIVLTFRAYSPEKSTDTRR